LQIVIAEGVLIGLLSWLAGVVLALPLGKLLSDAVGAQFLQVSLSYTFSGQGALLWLALVIMLAALASYLPAQRAVRLTVREVLVYEG
jgi:putative ABC transport system permease protein